ncbi:hypothetical protein F4821DRAFT_81143 [Hypoxylon rubiginosum]|uniref:Uncharacterized protein n=1 Tax=Hypoxylon rubiginosum TaxID=110542 RepID=A0ACC0D811_9PEZI|nr:hypothetical protein F4821DRAFT_81143 [Hypoxylon rubiginosum]
MAPIVENAPKWTVKRTEIKHFIDRITKRRVSTFIQGPHLERAPAWLRTFGLVQAKLPGTRLVYIIPMFAEEVLLRDYLSSEVFNWQLPTPISYHAVCQEQESSLPAGSLSK